jgi:NAD+ synthase (glutamine-hydrolysing)
MRIVAQQLNPTVGALEENADAIIAAIERSRNDAADLIVFPELALCGYPPEDFLLLPHFVAAVEQQLQRIVEASHGIAVVVGTIRCNTKRQEKGVFNSVAVIDDGKILGYHDKILLPNYDVFRERRYFEAGTAIQPWEIKGKRIAITICEDVWHHHEHILYHTNPLEDLIPHKPDILINVAASPFSVAKLDQRLSIFSDAARKLGCPMLYCNQVGGNGPLIFDGYSLFLDKNGQVIKRAAGFKEDAMVIDFEEKEAYTPQEYHCDKMGDLFNALVLGVRDYFMKSGFTKACLGLSGGIDSALVTCIAQKALGKENVLALTMPSQYTSKESLEEAHTLAQHLGVECREISIDALHKEYLGVLQPHFTGEEVDTTEENLQARIRGMILMAFSNKFGYVVLSTGNKSEMATGYFTLYGDSCGGLGVISDITKDQVYDLARSINKEREIIPANTILKPPSAELRAGQKDSDELPPYECIDNIVRGYVEDHMAPEEIALRHGYDNDVVAEIVKKIHRNEYKRYQTPPGLRVSSKSFSSGRHFPIVQRWV